MKAEKPVLGHIFPYISGSTGPIVSKQNRVHPRVDPHRSCERYENRFKTAICIGPSKWKTWSPFLRIFESFGKNLREENVYLLLENYRTTEEKLRNIFWEVLEKLWNNCEGF